MVGWHHQLNGYMFEQTPGHGEGQGSPACYCQQGHKELDMLQSMGSQGVGHDWATELN